MPASVAPPTDITVLAALSEAGHPVNEDAIGATPAAAWVIDGTSGPFGHRLLPGPSDATWLAATLSQVLAARFAASCADPAAHLTSVAASLAAGYASAAAGAVPPHEQPSACLGMAARDQAGGLHLFNIGDCRILIERHGVVTEFGTSGIARLEAAAVATLIHLRSTMEEPWPVLRQLLRHNFEHAMNRPDGYWVTHPSLPWVKAVQHRALLASEVEHILLMSDGFARLIDVFAAYDAPALVATALHGAGLAELFSELRRREAADPDCRRYPRLRPMDDASAVLLRVNGGA